MLLVYLLVYFSRDYDCFSWSKINKLRFEEATSELVVAKCEETEEKTKIKKLMKEKGLLFVMPHLPGVR